VTHSLTVGAVVVSYNTRDLLLECLAALELARAAGELERIIVIDSSSPDGSAETARIAFPDITVVELPNRGYGAAANAGLRRLTTDAVFILNADAIVQPGAVGRLAHTLIDRPDVAAAGPNLRYPSGRPQPSRRRFPERWTPLFESTVLQEWFPNNRLARRYYVDDVPDGCRQDVDWLYGAALLVRRTAYEQVGGFDERLAMYCEETEWCLRFQQAGWKVLYVPEAVVTHHEGASSDAGSPQQQINFDMSRVELQRRIFGDRTAELVRTGLLAGYTVQIARDAAKWLVGHKRPLRARRMRLHADVLRNGLRTRPELRS
jgi:GT2 family glycosyltransferase